MKFTCIFNNLNKSDANIAGGKGASLGEMIQSGILVPEGFVVLSNTFDRFLHETDLSQEIESTLKGVDHKAIHTVESASEKIRGLIEKQEIPKDIADEVMNGFKLLKAEFVAVRSSATAEDGIEHAWAGQLESYLNTTESTLLEHVKKCWSSLFTSRAIFYRFEKELHETEISVAVVVQKMVQSEVSGIAFSVHPITEDRNQLVIEAGYGLGEAIVSGSITPDSYVVEKEPRKIIDTTVNNQKRGLFKSVGGGNEWREISEPKASSQVLDEKEILELSELVVKIERHYGFPCDIEWAYESNKFYITQSRPITTLSKQENRTLQQSLIGNPDQYQRLFQVGGMPYLVSDAFMDEYRKIDGLAMLAHGTWTTFLPREAIKRTLAEGLKLYSDKQKFKEYENGFEAYKLETSKLFERLSKKSALMKNEVDSFLQSLTHLFHYYRRTEFFATDEAYQHSLKDEITRQNLKQFEHIKNSGREYLNKLFFGGESYLTKILGILTNQFNTTDENLRLYCKKDILSLFDSKRVSESALKSRRLAYVMVGGESLIYIEGKEAEAIVAKFDTALHEFHKELRGKTANKGVVKGKAKVIIADYGNFDGLKKVMESMKKGDVLIAETTSPELMPACSKASAIVTNQGGMMSHAAIVSREMGIPCVVGTGNATDLIKDGDMVEVDGNNGLVRILSNSEFRKEDYILSFWVQGVSIFVTDIHLDVYSHLGILFVIDNGMFKQYFLKTAYEKALDEGLKFYSDKNAVKEYKKDLQNHCEKLEEFFNKEIKDKSDISKDTLSKFFAYATKLVGDYTKMNFEYTDKAFTERERNKTIEENLSIVATFKDEVRAIMNKTLFENNGYLPYIWKVLSEKFSVTPSLLDNLTQKEILALYDGQYPNEKVSKRQEAFVYSYKSRTPFEDNEAHKIIKNFEEKIDETDILKGQVASKGKISGRVKIIPVDYSDFARVNREIEKMQVGDILVAETTAPELMVACKKAGAIVTDMGGLMSHAAIVSRELGIPCIVGTRYGSKILKDGDMVEADGNTGVVRIIERVQRG
ncbi:MAG: hypothetical protein A2653_01570 [Candidatus Zambryskibacteria bacterium RIFCSPHIGHO2_01_FULL_43_25]|uniref:Phosphoenolpyruvate synthase n=1 Tax=Candidatus Zambryskibacteria bacterium RIFCSPLOWO2_01_FULL_45_21 TaxID=1802761 RepID=A0A1G2U2Q7_9BACT|nr:MAG: hypothetical protein A2653_01570 [Candidatus Zambryskibacteria bacterium RIFCSPHIGHO2_01_FULL_43_25]OHA99938.1 MAG: hypothetical protein A3E94_02140 [Candidatus Zambryskibacteria bacterium RIFCSPHIGHO2_12_FULL_44_12b]OHB03806.1 MAG: hypothetical protein A3B14_03895 [Candidatus Zambryskibacteria bacterium RIFCSPLOWO2_01_FULL_45_21]